MATEASSESAGDTRRVEEVSIYTIGFTGRSAENFFETLKSAGVRKVIDVRLKNSSQLAAFTKKDDLRYFLRVIAGIDYVHIPELAPSKEIFDEYRKKQLDWNGFAENYKVLIEERGIIKQLKAADFDRACLLCSEADARQCHRSLLAERLRAEWQNVAVMHL